MLDSSPEYKLAIVGDVRKMAAKALVDIIDPDIVFGTVDGDVHPVSVMSQVHDKVFDLHPYATLESNRWLLNGQYSLIPETGANEQIGILSNSISGDDGTFSPAIYFELRFSNVSILQACSVYFPGAETDGIPEEYTVEVRQGGTAYFSKTITGNTSRSKSFDGFTVYNPDSIRVTIFKWRLPRTRARVVEIVPGIYEEWSGDTLAKLSINQQGDVSCLSLPYGTCDLSMDNLDRRFEPRNKAGIFKSLEERQGIKIFLGVELPSGVVEYRPVGIYYQFSGGWKTSKNSMIMEWKLVDIIGLLTDRGYIPPETLPTDLEGWVASLVAQLGVNFVGRYIVDPNYAKLPLTVRDPSDVIGVSCGDLLLFACMVTGTWPRADASTGYLAVEPLWDQGNKLTLDNMPEYPEIEANEDIAAIFFTLNDGNDTQLIISGNSTASNKTSNVNNPFIKTKEQAQAAARTILSQYGGNLYTIVGRGDPASEIGDVDTVWLDESSAATSRRISQEFNLSSGVLVNCQSTLLQADGSFMFQNRVVITSPGDWKAPAGVAKLRVILVQKGGDGEAGADGTWDSAGADGADGLGGKVWTGVIDINPEQVFPVSFGGETVFGAYSSANGERYQYGFTDIASGDSFARTGVRSPIPGSGDGGAGGAGGIKGNRHDETYKDDEGNSHTTTVIDNYPGPGQPGVKGVSGCVVVYYDKPDGG